MGDRYAHGALALSARRTRPDRRPGVAWPSRTRPGERSSVVFLSRRSGDGFGTARPSHRTQGSSGMNAQDIRLSVGFPNHPKTIKLERRLGFRVSAPCCRSGPGRRKTARRATSVARTIVPSTVQRPWTRKTSRSSPNGPANRARSSQRSWRSVGSIKPPTVTACTNGNSTTLGGRRDESRRQGPLFTDGQDSPGYLQVPICTRYSKSAPTSSRD